MDNALLFRKLSASFRDLPIQPVANTRPPRLSFELAAPEGGNRPGFLYVLLRTIFQQGLAVEASLAGAQDDRAPVRGTIVGLPRLVWAIVAVATACDANILHLSTCPELRSHTRLANVGFEIGQTVELELAVAAEPEITWWNASEFEYRLKSLHGDVAAEVMRGSREP